MKEKSVRKCYYYCSLPVADCTYVNCGLLYCLYAIIACAITDNQLVLIVQCVICVWDTPPHSLATSLGASMLAPWALNTCRRPLPPFGNPGSATAHGLRPALTEDMTSTMAATIVHSRSDIHNYCNSIITIYPSNNLICSCLFVFQVNVKDDVCVIAINWAR